MARLSNNFLPLQGALNKQVVFKKCGDIIVVGKYPDMGRIKPSAEQKTRRSIFKDAVAYAQEICKNPALKAAYQQKIKKGSSVYHFAIKEYLRDHQC